MSDDRVTVRASEIPTRLEEDENGHATITPEHTVAAVLRYLIRTNNYGNVLNTLLMLGREDSGPSEVEAEITYRNAYPPESTDTKTIWSSGDEN